MVRPLPGTHRNPGRRPPSLELPAQPPAAALAAEAAAAEAAGAEPAEAAAAAGPAEAGAAQAAAEERQPIPGPHIPPNHLSRGRRPLGLARPKPADVRMSSDGAPLPAPAPADAAPAVGGGEGARPTRGGRLPPGDISFHTLCAFATSIAKCKGKGSVEAKRGRVVK